MIVCSCTGATKKEIEQMAREGLGPYEMGAEYGVGRCCGSCFPRLLEVLAEIPKSS